MMVLHLTEQLKSSRANVRVSIITRSELDFSHNSLFSISYSQALSRTIIRLRKKIRKLETEEYVTNLNEELGHREQEVEYLRSLLDENDIEYTIGHLG